MKTVTLKEEAYNKLSSLKEKNESFSDTVERLYEKANPSIERFFGIWKNKGFEKPINDWKKIKEKDKELFIKKMSELGSR